MCYGVVLKGTAPYFIERQAPTNDYVIRRFYLGNYMEKRTCCFIGHRKIQDKELALARVERVVRALVMEQGVRVFHFGSRSEFDDICHVAVSKLQGEYADIVRVNYRCKSEYAVKKEEKAELEERCSRLLKRSVLLKDFEEEKISDRVENAGKASYIERNQEMIDDSEYCVVYYRRGYTPEGNEYDTTSGKSGTKISYDYAVRKNKKIINVAEFSI